MEIPTYFVLSIRDLFSGETGPFAWKSTLVPEKLFTSTNVDDYLKLIVGHGYTKEDYDRIKIHRHTGNITQDDITFTQGLLKNAIGHTAQYVILST